MRRYILYRILSVLITLFFVSLFVFFMMDRAEGDYRAYLYGDEAYSAGYGNQADEPFFSEYAAFIKSFISLNWGRSASGRDIKELIGTRFPVTISLTLLSLMLSAIISFPLSFHAASKESSGAERTLIAISVLGFSLPSFLIAFALILVFAILLRLFPVAGYIPLNAGFYAHFRSLFLPSLSVAIVQSSLYPRMLLVSLRENLNADYIASAKSWGLSDRDALFREALRPSMPVAISMLFQNIASGIAGSAVVENVFALPGIGAMLTSAALSRDSYLLGIALLLLSVIIAVLFIISEVLIMAADPRLRRKYA